MLTLLVAGALPAASGDRPLEAAAAAAAPADRALGHRGNHVAYLDEDWQAAALIPALGADVTAGTLTAAWAALHAEDE